MIFVFFLVAIIFYFGWNKKSFCIYSILRLDDKPFLFSNKNNGDNFQTNFCINTLNESKNYNPYYHVYQDEYSYSTRAHV